jgi:hypothetical protein
MKKSNYVQSLKLTVGGEKNVDRKKSKQEIKQFVSILTRFDEFSFDLDLPN